MDAALSYDARTSEGPIFFFHRVFSYQHVVTIKGSEKFYKGKIINIIRKFGNPIQSTLSIE